MGTLVQGQLGGRYIVPGPVQEGHLPTSVGLGKLRLVAAAQQVCRFRWESGGGQAAFQAFPENVRQTRPVRRTQIVEYKGIPAVAVDCQQGGSPPQGDDVEIPAEAAIRFLAVRQGFDAKIPLEGGWSGPVLSVRPCSWFCAVHFLESRHNVFQDQGPHTVRITAEIGLFQREPNSEKKLRLYRRDLRQGRDTLTGGDGFAVRHMGQKFVQ